MGAPLPTWVVELQGLCEQFDGHLTPAAVVDAARDPDSALHLHFEWDDSVAAASYRLVQAGHLIRRAKVKVSLRPDEPDVPLRAFLSVDDRASGQPWPTYQPAETVLTTPRLRSIVLDRMRQEHLVMRRKYQHFTEFADLLRATLDDLGEQSA